MTVSGPPPPPSPRPRPRPLWFFVGGGLLLLGVVAFVVLLVLTLSHASRTDDVKMLGSSGSTVHLRVTPDSKRMLFVPQGQPVPRCRLADAHGTALPLTSPHGSVTVGVNGRDWQGIGTFTSSTPDVEITCTSALPGQEVRVGAPLGVGFVGGILATILVPLLLGGAGGVILLVTTILWFTRPPRAAANA